MRTFLKDWKKHLLPLLPYLAFVYLFDKLGQAVRLASGIGASEKLLHIGQGFTDAFSSPLPGLHPADLCIGIAGAVLIRLIVYVKAKNAKKYRRGIEYGSARWDAYYLLKEVFYGHRRRKHYDPIQQDYRAVLPSFSR